MRARQTEMNAVLRGGDADLRDILGINDVAIGQIKQSVLIENGRLPGAVILVVEVAHELFGHGDDGLRLPFIVRIKFPVYSVFRGGKHHLIIPFEDGLGNIGVLRRGGFEIHIIGVAHMDDGRLPEHSLDIVELLDIERIGGQGNHPLHVRPIFEIDAFRIENGVVHGGTHPPHFVFSVLFDHRMSPIVHVVVYDVL